MGSTAGDGDASGVDRHEQDPQRGADADDRDRTAMDRDDTSDAHDEVAGGRDGRADARDVRAEVRDDTTGRFDPGAASDRAGAKRDRQAGAGDRRHAKDDRSAASADRALSMRERVMYVHDGLTGAYRRESGMLELSRDTTRAKRTLQPFVLAFVDVDGLKATNDSLGHAAGDQVLCDVVGAIRAHVRSYDLIVRFGGDEFLCGLAGLTLTEATQRFARINTYLAETHQGAITTGLAELDTNDQVEDLIQRADAALYTERERRTQPRTTTTEPAPLPQHPPTMAVTDGLPPR